MSTLPPVAAQGRLPLLLLVGGCGVVQTLTIIAVALLTRELLGLWLAAPAAGGDALLRVGQAELASLAGLAVLAAGARWLERVGAERLGQSYVHALRLAMFDTLASPQATRDVGSGVHMVRFSNDLTALRNWIALGLARAFNALLLLLGVIVAISLLSPTAGAVMACLLLVTLAGLLGLGSRLERTVALTRRERGRLANTVAELVDNAPRLAAHGRAGHERDRLARKSDALGHALARRAFWIGSLRGATELSHRLMLLSMLTVCAVTLPGDAASLVAVLTVSALLGPPLKALGRVTEYWKNATVARRKLTAAVSASSPPPRRRKLPPGEGVLTLRNVKIGELFSLPTLQLEGRERLAVAGANGAGKSTLLAVLAGLEPPARGRVLLDGVATDRLSQGDRRRAIGMAHQREPLATGSVSKNVRFRLPGADAETVAAACRRAGLLPQLAELPDGLRTRVGRRGRTLSEGEQARVRLARAVLGTPRLLILDEIDAALDDAGREALMALLDDYPGTVVFASHDEQLLARGTLRLTLREDEAALEYPRELRETGS